MKFIIVILVTTLLAGSESSGRGRTKYRGRQLPFPGQPNVTEESWTNEDVPKVENRQGSWEDDIGSIEDLDDTVVVGDVLVPKIPNAPRQYYPGWAESTGELPKPIPPYQPTQQPEEPPIYQMSSQQPSYQPTQRPTQQPSYQPTQRPTQQPSYQPTQRPTQQPPYQPTHRPTQQPPYQPTKRPTHQPPYQPTQSPTLPQPQPILPPGCLAARGQFASPNNCGNYLNCWDDVVIEQQCPNGLLFNEDTGLCDFEFNVNCGNRPAATPKPPLPPGSKRCPDLNGRYRSSTNCSEFYVCLSGSPIKFSCPRGLVYNDAVSVCDYVYNVDCQGASTPKPEALPRPEPSKPTPSYPSKPTQPQQTTQTQRPQPTFPPSAYPESPWFAAREADDDNRHQRSLNKKEETLVKEENPGNEPSKETVESQTTGSSTIMHLSDLMKATAAELNKVPCEEGSLHRIDDKCSSVIVCVNNHPKIVNCPEGLAYDVPSDSCRQSDIAKC